MKIVLISQTHWKGLRNPPGSCTDYTLRTNIIDQWISINDLYVQDCTEYKTWLLPQGTKDRIHACAHTHTHKGKQYRAVKINCLMNSPENKCHNNSEEGRRSLWVGAAGKGFREEMDLNGALKSKARRRGESTTSWGHSEEIWSHRQGETSQLPRSCLDQEPQHSNDLGSKKAGKEGYMVMVEGVWLPSLAVWTWSWEHHKAPERGSVFISEVVLWKDQSK